MKYYPKLLKVILILFPRSMLSRSYYSILRDSIHHTFIIHAGAPHVYRRGRRVYTTAAFESSDNERQNAYYIPELEMVLKQYQDLMCDPTFLSAFVEGQSFSDDEGEDPSDYIVVRI
jgi:hypothetical protein